MDDNRKAQIYNQLMFENDKISNKISSIKGESFELNQNQQEEIRRLQIRQQQIMVEASKLYWLLHPISNRRGVFYFNRYL